MNCRYENHTVYKTEYHFVWATKYRYQMLQGEIGLRVRDLIRQNCQAFEIEILKGVVSKDHVHILVSAPPQLVPSEIMRQIKGRSSSKLFNEYPYINKRYWGSHFWARGYFFATADDMTEEMIKDYLPHHVEPKKDDGFGIELN